jgi:ESCO1/2 acetyl-transferase
MLDAARRNCMFGIEVGLDEMAFSQPTAMGKALAFKYFGRQDFLIYIE